MQETILMFISMLSTSFKLKHIVFNGILLIQNRHYRISTDGRQAIILMSIKREKETTKALINIINIPIHNQ